DSVAGDIGVGAAKTGMLGAAPTVHAVVEALTRWRIRPLVVDPVAVSSTGAALVDPAGLAALRVALVPLADLLTPNLAEAAALTGSGPIGDRSAMEAVARDLLRLGAGAVLVKGGHLDGPDAPDLLATSEGGWTWLEGPRVPGRHNHGTGCVLSAAVTARLARGEELGAAVEAAKDFVARAIRVGVELGAGVGAVNPAGPATDA
ncbi:MAG: bifunctional hydroxymethylpyrimidine kinase/phosphomethylpyrimidine kinase, partial [Acidimicrobiia bacterium]